MSKALNTLLEAFACVHQRREQESVANQGQAMDGFSELANHRGVAEKVVAILAEAKAEIEQLRAIVDRLPKTADGVPVAIGDIIWIPNRHVEGSVEDTLVRDGSMKWGGPARGLVKCRNAKDDEGPSAWIHPKKPMEKWEYGGCGTDIGDCYSTYGAAKAAKEDTDG